MTYRYDLFISYKRDAISLDWMLDHFLPIFHSKLQDQMLLVCQRPLETIFLDIADTDPRMRSRSELAATFEGIPAGANWDAALTEALRDSRAMLALWSPRYFSSDWCLKEWEAFQNRHSAAGTGQAVPITVHDCDNLNIVPKVRPIITHVQPIRFNKTYYAGAALTAMQAYLDLQDLCDLLAESVARMICRAPEFGYAQAAPIVPVITAHDRAPPGPIGQRRLSNPGWSD